VSDDLQYLKGIGPVRAEAFQNAGIKTIAHLRTFYPRKYLDRTNIVPLNQLELNKEVTVIGKIEALGIRRLRKSIFYLVISDGEGFLEATWFQNVQYFKKMFSVGLWVSLSGKISFYRGYQMTHPDYDLIGEGDLSNMIHTGKVLPVYPGSADFKNSSINSYSLRKIFFENKEIVFDNISESLSPDIVETHKFPDRKSALINIHLPENSSLLQKCIHRLKYEEFFFLQVLLALQKQQTKEIQPGISFEKASDQLTSLYKKLPFSMTVAQMRVMKEIRADMKRPNPMNRLLQGDVGSGKTLIALMAMLIAIDNGYQASLMVPTEILAEQHFNNIRQFLFNSNIQVSLLTGSTKSKNRKEILEKVASGDPQIIIGTHALIQEKVNFSKLGLVIIDEQHRFGVMQRSQLVDKGINADTLVMTATPIPRSLALTVYGNLDVSILDEMPKGRKPVDTRWRFDESADKIYKFVAEKARKNEQTYIVYPLIEESEKVDLKAATESYEFLREKYFNNIPIDLLHGRMKSEDKERIMKDFSSGKTKILVTTTVIEVGVDVPKATVILIEHAERFGLAQLHQLRGRVGRSDLQSYCILKTPNKITEGAELRMRAMTGSNDGFFIAEEDMRLRGWGDFFGTKQHGMPEFKLANPITDQHLLKQAREDAFSLVKNDPELRLSGNMLIKKHIQQNYSHRIALIKIG
jgi:ATP-dependent DNA helicase RecG